MFLAIMNKSFRGCVNVKKILITFVLCLLLPVVVSAKVGIPQFFGGHQEYYEFAAADGWKLDNGLIVNFQYVHFSQRSASSRFGNYHFDGEKFMFRISGISEEEFTDLNKKSISYRIGDGKAKTIPLNSDITKALGDGNDAIFYSSQSKALYIWGYLIQPDLMKLSKESKLEFILYFKDKKREPIIIPISANLVEEITEVKTYKFNKENKEELRKEASQTDVYLSKAHVYSVFYE